MVAASAVSGWTDSMRPRRSAPERSGREEVHEVGRQVGRGGRLGDADEVVAQSTALGRCRGGRLESRGHGIQSPRCGPFFLLCARESGLDSCSSRTKQTSGVPMVTRPVRPTTQIQTIVGLDPKVAAAAAVPPRRGRRQRGADHHRRGAQLCRRVERADGRGDPQRGAAGARRLPHPRHPAGRRRPEGAGHRGRLPARSRRGPQRSYGRGAARGLPHRRPRLVARHGRRGRGGRGRRRASWPEVRRAGLRLHRRAVGGLGRRAHRRAREQRAGPPAQPRAARAGAAHRRAGRRGQRRGRARRLGAARRADRASCCPSRRSRTP